MKKAVQEYLKALGRKGGASKSEAKKKAVRENLKKARMVKLRRFRDGDA